MFTGHSDGGEQCKVRIATPALPSQATVKSRRRPADSSLAGALEERASARLKPPPCDRSWVAESRRSRAGRWQAEVGVCWPEELMGKTEALESPVCVCVWVCSVAERKYFRFFGALKKKERDDDVETDKQANTQQGQQRDSAFCVSLPWQKRRAIENVGLTVRGRQRIMFSLMCVTALCHNLTYISFPWLLSKGDRGDLFFPPLQ